MMKILADGSARPRVRTTPRTPGRWTRIEADGRRRIYRIKDQNGTLYATVMGIIPVAVPIEQLPGHWEPCE